MARGDHRRGAIERLALAVAAALLAGIAGCGSDGGGDGEQTESAAPSGRDDGPVAAERPNIVVVLTDDQDVASLRAMPTVRRRIGRRGVRFANAFTAVPLCCPSRASLLTGRYPHNHGVISNLPPRGGYPRLDHERTLATWLADAGYRTGWIGKYLNGYGNPAVGTDPLEIPPGWDVWRVPVDHTELQMYGYRLNENGRLRDYGAEPRDYQTDVLARKATRFVARSAADGEPFLLVVSTLAPHRESELTLDPGAPRNPRPAPRHDGAFAGEELPLPPSYNEPDVADKPADAVPEAPLGADELAAIDTRHRSRLESLLAVDELVGDLLDELRRSDELERTLVVFTSDQGQQLGEHRLTSKLQPYDESLRVPLLIKGPGVPEGEVRRAVTANVDLAPTFAELAGADPDVELDGTSLVPAIADDDALRDRTVLARYVARRGFAAVLGERWVYLERKGGGTELYDLRRDPHQLDNAVADPAQAARVERLAARLRELRRCAGAGCR